MMYALHALHANAYHQPMILAQSEPAVHEVIIQSTTPWHIYIAAVIGGLIAIVGWIVVHWTSQSRDLKNWRRTTLMQSTMELLAASNERFDAINDSPVDQSAARALMRSIDIQFETIRLLGDDKQMDAAHKIWQAHTLSSSAFSHYNAGRRHDPQVLTIARMDQWELEDHHRNLTQSLRNSIKRKNPGINTNLNAPFKPSERKKVENPADMI